MHEAAGDRAHADARSVEVYIFLSGNMYNFDYTLGAKGALYKRHDHCALEGTFIARVAGHACAE
jgi:hypothetical protein